MWGARKGQVTYDSGQDINPYPANAENRVSS